MTASPPHTDTPPTAPPCSPTFTAGHPFHSAEEAWFWFIAAHTAAADGARHRQGRSDQPRPCEPVDIYRTVDRLYRNRQLLMDHVLVLKHYGQRFLPPDPRRVREARAHTMWREALRTLESALIHKGIVQSRVIPVDFTSHHRAHPCQ